MTGKGGEVRETERPQGLESGRLRKPKPKGEGRGANQGGSDKEQSLRAIRPKGQKERSGAKAKGISGRVARLKGAAGRKRNAES